jgi:hypothetical protein
LSTSPSNNSTPILEERLNNSFFNSKYPINYQENEVTFQGNDDIIENYEMSHENLNDQVASLLKKAKGENGSSRDIKRRQRKNRD